MRANARSRRWLAIALVSGAWLVAACGGSTGDDGDGTPAPGATEDGGGDGGGGSGDDGGATLAPAGERSFYTYDPVQAQIIRIDPDTGDASPLTSMEGPAAYAMTHGDGAFWLGFQSGDVVRVDPADGSTSDIATGVGEQIFELAAGDGAVWALHGIPGAGGTVTRIDAASGAPSWSTPAADGLSLFHIAAGEGAGWVVGSSPEMATTVYEADPSSGALTDREVPMVIDSIAVGDGALWLGGTAFPDGLSGVSAIGRFDLASDELTIIEVGGEAGSIAIGPEAVWAVAGLTPDGMVVYRIDPATNQVAAAIPVGDGDSGLVRISTGAGYVWVSSTSQAWVIDPSTNEVVGSADSVGTYGQFFP